jgi:hypothetical protein
MQPTPSINARLLKAQPLIAVVALWLGSFAASAITTNFSTGFESTEGYISGTGLTGQQSWVGYVVSTNLVFTNATSAGNGVISPGLGGSGQAAYVGLTPLPKAYNNYIEQLRFLNLDPIGSGLSQVDFSAKVKIMDSTVFFYDYFYWDFYNTNGNFLFGIEFNNDFLRISAVNSTNKASKLGNYTNGVEYALGVSMNFASNRYSVTWNGSTITNNLPIALNGLPLSLGSIAAVWQPSTPTNGADNYMIFDDMRVISSVPVPARPQLKLLTPGGSSAATLQLTGQEGARFAVDGSTNLVTWLAVATNTVSGGTAAYVDATVVGKTTRYYRARWVP